jgi:hypothetical protein
MMLPLRAAFRKEMEGPSKYLTQVLPAFVY